jgi:hypothetical protein
MPRSDGRLHSSALVDLITHAACRYRIQYEDGDAQDMTVTEVRKHLVPLHGGDQRCWPSYQAVAGRLTLLLHLAVQNSLSCPSHASDH